MVRRALRREDGMIENAWHCQLVGECGGPSEVGERTEFRHVPARAHPFPTSFLPSLELCTKTTTNSVDDESTQRLSFE